MTTTNGPLHHRSDWIAHLGHDSVRRGKRTAFLEGSFGARYSAPSTEDTQIKKLHTKRLRAPFYLGVCHIFRDGFPPSNPRQAEFV